MDEQAEYSWSSSHPPSDDCPWQSINTGATSPVQDLNEEAEELAYENDVKHDTEVVADNGDVRGLGGDEVSDSAAAVIVDNGGGVGNYDAKDDEKEDFVDENGAEECRVSGYSPWVGH